MGGLIWSDLRGSWLRRLAQGLLTGTWVILLLVPQAAAHSDRHAGAGTEAAAAGPVLRIGVLAFRPNPVTLARWQPLADYLGHAIPGLVFRIEPYPYAELEAAVVNGKVDFILTQPSHYIALSHRAGLSSPLATLVNREGPVSLDRFGGVIFTTVDRGDINALADLRGRRIAVSTRSSLGSYQMQAYELSRAGVAMPQDVLLQETGTPQDKAVSDVLAGKADAGFVRTGVLEAMAREGKVDIARLKIVNLRRESGFPFLLSTRLYPEWPFVAMPVSDPDISRQVMAALLSLPHDSEAARAMQIQGFAIPGDYRPVDELLRELHLPPFDRLPDLTLADIWQRHQGGIAATALAASLLLIMAILFLVRMNGRLSLERARVRESEQHYRVLANSGSVLIWTSGVDMLCDYFNEGWLRFTGRTLAQELGQGWLEGVHPEDMDRCLEIYTRAFAQRESFTMDYRLRRADGEYRWITDEGVPRYDSQGAFAGYIGYCMDISQRKEAETNLRLAASVFTSAHEGIMITDVDGIIVDINQAFSRITGYERNDVLGKTPAMLKSGRHGPDFYAGMWQTLEREGHWQGEVWNRHRDGAIYAALLTVSTVYDEQGIKRHYVSLFSDITALKEHQRQLELMAHYDGLTGLPNRILLADRLHQAMVHARRRNQLLAVAYIDLDGFKVINDTHGHEAGDQLLMTIARRMKSCLREGDTIARLGGDEFVAVIIDLEDMQSSHLLLQRLQAALALPVQLESVSLSVSGSIGITYYPQAEEVDADQMLRQADQAMYQAKLAGKNRYHLFDTEQDRHVRDHHESVEHIRQALERSELVLHYQPKVNLRTGRIIGAEALIRWQHPVRGLLPPGLFLPEVEGHALGVEIGEWVMETALTQMEAWQAQGLDIPVSVNVSAHHLQQPNFVSRLQSLVAGHPGLKPWHLELEVLETSALGDIMHVSQVIQACADLSVGFALDDFGTGYASLTYLKRLPVQMLKVDQSFVRDMLDDPDDMAILDGVLGLAASFNRHVIAEGVETCEHARFLMRMGCELVQGYGIARPMPAEQLARWHGAWSPEATWSNTQRLGRGDLDILFARVEHSAWVRGVVDCLHGRRLSVPAMDHQECRFGRWLQRVSPARRHRLAPLFQNIERLHQGIHTLADELLTSQEYGQYFEPLARIDELTEMRDRMFDLLEDLMLEAEREVGEIHMGESRAMH